MTRQAHTRIFYKYDSACRPVDRMHVATVRAFCTTTAKRSAARAYRLMSRGGEHASEQSWLSAASSFPYASRFSRAASRSAPSPL